MILLIKFSFNLPFTKLCLIDHKLVSGRFFFLTIFTFGPVPMPELFNSTRYVDLFQKRLLIFFIRVGVHVKFHSSRSPAHFAKGLESVFNHIISKLDAKFPSDIVKRIFRLLDGLLLVENKTFTKFRSAKLQKSISKLHVQYLDKL